MTPRQQTLRAAIRGALYVPQLGGYEHLTREEALRLATRSLEMHLVGELHDMIVDGEITVSNGLVSPGPNIPSHPQGDST